MVLGGQLKFSGLRLLVFRIKVLGFKDCRFMVLGFRFED